MINLQSNYPVLPEQDAEWKRLLHEAVDLYGAESVRLPAFGGGERNRELAAAWLGVTAERTFLAEAGHHALLATVMAAGLAGKTVAVEALTYPWFVRQLQVLGCKVVPVAIDADCLLPDALRDACAREQAAGTPVAAVYTMPSLHNPTGAVASVARRREVVAVARQFGCLLIEDGAYGFLLDGEPARYTELAPELAFYVESLSKRYAPGLRTAFLVGPAEMKDDMALALRLVASGSSTLLASLGCAMAADGRLAATIAAKRVEGAKRLALTRELLSGFDVMGEGNSWHVWVSLPAGDLRTDAEIEAACEVRRVGVTGARWFTAPGVEVARAVRLGLGGETEWDRCAEGLRVFAEVVRSAGAA